MYFCSMKLPLKTITILVCTALAAIFLFQLYCLHNLYETRKQEMEESIAEALRISDYNEMVLRIAKLSQKTQTHGEVSYATGYKMDVNNQMVYAGSVTTVRQKGYDAIIMKDEELTDTITIRRDSVAGKRHMRVDVHSYDTEETEKNKALVSGGNGLFSAVVDDQKSVRDLTQMMQQGIHNGIDLLSEPDVAVFDSLLTLRLQEHHIDTSHRLEQFHFHVNAVDETDTLGIDTLNMITTPHYQPTEKAVHYDYHYTSSQHDLYRLWMEPVRVSVLKSLKGIIATSLLTLIVLAFTFWYLIHTLLKQKTLDEMKSDFTHNITHELKTPIAVAYAANDALLHFHQGEDAATREKYLRVSQEQLQRLGDMVEQILSVSAERQKNFVLKLEVLNVKEVVAAAVETQKMKNGKPLHIATAIQPDDLTLTADRTLLLQMLGNLLDNAVKYSAAEADINVCGGITRDGTTFISVSDRGIGITSEQQRHIFEKFYRVPNGNLHNVKGHGLGLYYVATMMRLHRGSVSVDSKPGEGSTFILHFPKPNAHTLNLLAWLMGGMLISFR